MAGRAVIRFALGFVAGVAFVYAWATFQLSTPESEPSDGPWPLYI